MNILKDQRGVTAPDANYEYGIVVNGVTYIDQQILADHVYAINKIVDLMGIEPNGNNENINNGYQIPTALDKYIGYRAFIGTDGVVVNETGLYADRLSVDKFSTGIYELKIDEALVYESSAGGDDEASFMKFNVNSRDINQTIVMQSWLVGNATWMRVICRNYTTGTLEDISRAFDFEIKDIRE